MWTQHRATITGRLTALLVTVAILLSCELQNSSSSCRQPYLNRPSALCTRVVSMVCLLDRWWSEPEDLQERNVWPSPSVSIIQRIFWCTLHVIKEVLQLLGPMRPNDNIVTTTSKQDWRQLTQVPCLQTPPCTRWQSPDRVLNSKPCCKSIHWTDCKIQEKVETWWKSLRISSSICQLRMSKTSMMGTQVKCETTSKLWCPRVKHLNMMTKSVEFAQGSPSENRAKQPYVLMGARRGPNSAHNGL